MGRRLIAPLALVLVLAAAVPATALEWQTVRTLQHVRGAADPQVAIDGHGKAAVVFSTIESELAGANLGMYLRRPGGGSLFSQPFGLRGRTEPAVAANPDGALGIASVDQGRLRVTLYAAPGPDPASPSAAPLPVTTVVEAAGASVSDPQIVLAGDGTATVAWASPPNHDEGPSTTRLYAVEVRQSGTPEPVQELSGPGRCSAVLDGNLRGDAVVLSRCSDPASTAVHVKPAGGVFGPPETVPGFELGATDATIDGAGTVLAVEAGDREPGPAHEYGASYSLRPAGGVFGARRGIVMPPTASGLGVESQEDGRTVAVWRELGSFVYAYRLPDGDFAPAGTVPFSVGTTSEPAGLAAAPTGPAVLWWREHIYVGRDPQLVQVVVATLDRPGGSVEGKPVSVPGAIGATFAPAFAINADGRAVGAWEQRCEGGGYAVMAVVRDDPGVEARQGPCQDTRPPKVIAVHKRALLRKRQLRVRIACDEACRYTASARVLRRGSRAPLARARTGAEQRLAARRGRTVRLKLSAREATRIRRALAKRRKLKLRLAVSVRDAYGSGRRWRIAVPVRR